MGCTVSKIEPHNNNNWSKIKNIENNKFASKLRDSGHNCIEYKNNNIQWCGHIICKNITDIKII